MREKIWIKIFGLFSLSAVFMVILTNYLIDPFGVFQTTLLKRHFQDNERYLKVEFLKEHKQTFNTFMMGSSRIGTTDPDVLEKYIPNSRVYNLSISASNIEDYVKYLHYFIQNDYPLTTLYLQIDYQDMMSFGHRDDDYLLRYHPDILDENHLYYYWKYLSITPTLNLKRKLLQNFAPDNENYVRYDFEESGMWFAEAKERKLLLNSEAYVKHEASFYQREEHIWGINTLKYEKILQGLTEITQLCEANNIELILFSSPNNQALLKLFKIDDVLMFLKDISEIHGFWFFSDYNSATCDNTNYYEAGHYRGVLGSIIAARIFKDETILVPEDFGFYIQKNEFSLWQNQIKTNLIQMCKTH